MKRVGLIAGEGKLPFIFATEAKRNSVEVIAFALKGVTSPDLTRHVDRIHWLKWGQFGKALLALSSSRVKHVAMLGKIRKPLLFKEEKIDQKARELLRGANDKRDYSILKEVGNILRKMGVEVISSATFLDRLIPKRGVLTRRQPDDREWNDIRFGKRIATEMARLDIGQTVCVKDNSVLSVEAAEGTDEVILRAGSLIRDGMVVVKVARPDQDMRFDVPLVGLDTINTLIDSRAKVLAIEEKKMFFMDGDDAVSLAEKSGMSIVVI